MILSVIESQAILWMPLLVHNVMLLRASGNLKLFPIGMIFLVIFGWPPEIMLMSGQENFLPIALMTASAMANELALYRAHCAKAGELRVGQLN